MTLEEWSQKLAMARCKMDKLPEPWGDGERYSGECICPICGQTYYRHPMDISRLSYDDRPFLHLLCSGERVKL